MKNFLKLGLSVFLISIFPMPEVGAESLRFARFEMDGGVSFGLVDGQEVEVLKGSPFSSYEKTGKKVSLSEVKLLVPCEAKQVFGAAGNMRPKDADPAPKPEHPEIFFKAPTALVPDHGEIVIPSDANRVVYEAEVVAVIGKTAKGVSVEEAPDYVLGITCGNDVSGPDWGEDFSPWRVKATDTFAPCGPFLVTGVDLTDVDFSLSLNGEVQQEGNTADLVHSIAELVSFISQYMTLQPGDLIYSGTQPPIGDLSPGDVVEVEVEGVGVLTNRVVAQKE